GTYNLTATASDAAGNTSAASTTYVVKVDTANPVNPVITSITTDTGSSSTDGITSDKTLVINGTAEANSVVTVRQGVSVIGTTITNGSGNWSYDYTGISLADGAYR